MNRRGGVSQGASALEVASSLCSGLGFLIASNVSAKKIITLELEEAAAEVTT